MANLRKPTRVVTSSSILLFLLVLLVFTCTFNFVSASSGGVMGGSFFDSDSSSSESYTSDSDSDRARDFHMHNSPPSVDDGDRNKEESHGGGPMFFFIIVTVGFFLVGFCKDKNGNSVSVLKLQVAMLDGVGNTVQKDINRIAKFADTSSLKGVSYLLTETMQILDGHPGYYAAGYSSVDTKQSREDGEKCYTQLSNEERAKFDEETLVNLNKKDKTSNKIQSYDEFSQKYTTESPEEIEKLEKEKLLSGHDKYIVVTVIVAAKGAHKLPNINGVEDLRKALQKLISILPKTLLAGQVLWTPQEEDDIISERKLWRDYPQLAKGMESFLVKKQE